MNTPPKPSSLKSEYPGGRGINLITENVHTVFASLSSAVPSQNAIVSYIDQLSYKYAVSQSVTVWFRGFFTPGKDSNYQFELVTNGDALLFLSTDSTSANKVF